MTGPETLNLIGRVCVAGYFLWATQFNVRTWQRQLDELRRIGMPWPVPALWAGLAMQALGSVLLLYPPTVLPGGVLLIAFTLAVDVMYHRFWTYADPGERELHKFFLGEHVAMIGGLLGLMAGSAATFKH